MSYILDALKKAERERGITQVPTLSTVHDTHETRRSRSWIVPTALIAILAVGLGFLLYMWNSGNRPTTESPEYAGRQYDAGLTAPGSASVRASAESASATDQPDQPENFASDNLPVRKAETERMHPGISTATTAAADIPRIPNEEIQSVSLPDQTIPQADTLMSEEPFPTSDDRQVSTTTSIDNEMPDSIPAPSDIPARTTVLQEAMESMDISILLYAENAADRLVFINGRKYVEGDYIDGRYLVESITQDGAVLRYEGEQAVLKPATN